MPGECFHSPLQSHRHRPLRQVFRARSAYHFFFFTFLLSSVPAGQPVIPDCFTYHKFPPTHKHSSILGSSPATKCPLLSRLLIILPQLGPSPRALQSKRSRKAPPYDSTSNTNVWYRPLWRDFSSRMVTSHPPRTVLFGRHFGQYKFPPLYDTPLGVFQSVPQCIISGSVADD